MAMTRKLKVLTFIVVLLLILGIVYSVMFEYKTEKQKYMLQEENVKTISVVDGENITLPIKYRNMTIVDISQDGTNFVVGFKKNTKIVKVVSDYQSVASLVCDEDYEMMREVGRVWECNNTKNKIMSMAKEVVDEYKDLLYDEEIKSGTTIYIDYD